jgi:hypothetical protein
MLGESGRVLLQTLQETIGRCVGNPDLYVISKYNRDKKSVSLWTCGEIQTLGEAGKNGKKSNVKRDYVRDALYGKKVIVFDSSVHSGKSMQALIKEVWG